jgi:hypothetical protein
MRLATTEVGAWTSKHFAGGEFGASLFSHCSAQGRGFLLTTALVNATLLAMQYWP